MAGSEKAIEIRQLSELEDLRAVVDLQQEIWGFADAELLPLRFFVVASRVGGHVLGAYDGGKLVAFCLGIPGPSPAPRPTSIRICSACAPSIRTTASAAVSN